MVLNPLGAGALENSRSRFWWLVALSVVASMIVSLGTTAPAAGQVNGGSCGADVVMVVDSSGSVDETELGLMGDAFKGFIDAFLPDTPTEMAIVDFDRIGRVKQGFTTDPAKLNATLDGLKSGGRTNWQDALFKARNLFPHRDAPDLIVFASDGRPNKLTGIPESDRKAALAAAVVEADAAKAAGARIVAIGIGNKLRVDKLEAIASSSDDVHTTQFDTLAATLAELAGELCPGPGPSCGADVVMVVDSSGSVDETELGLMRDAFSDFVDGFLPQTPTQMAVVDFSRKAKVLQGFSSDIDALNVALGNLKSGGRTNWQDGLLKARNLFPHRDSPDLIVFASDGRPNMNNDSDDFDRQAGLAAAVVEADAAKAAGARIVAIGIGNHLRRDNLEAIASSNADVHTTDFETLAATLGTLAGELCGGTIVATKLMDADGDLGTTDDQTPVEGWTFTADALDGAAVPPTAITDASGSVVFVITPDGVTVDLYETLTAPYVLLDASCTGATDNGTSNLLDGVTGIVVGGSDAVVCTFINASEGTTE